MRTVELARVATAAEALRLRRIARRQAFRVAFGAVALVFGLAVLVAAHVLIVVVLQLWLATWLSVLILLGLDLVVAGAFGFLAIKSPPDPVEIEAKQIRVAAMAELKRSLTVMGMAAEITGLAVRSGARSGRARRGFASAAAEVASRLIGR